MRACIFDTETSGLLLPSIANDAEQPRIIELGALITDGTTILKTLSQLLNPGFAISAEITKITGITNADLVGKPSFIKFLPELITFFDGCDLLLAHNAPFDVGMLASELKRAGCDKFPWPSETICTLQEYTAFMGHGPNLKSLYERIIGKPLEQTHRALDDVKAMFEIIQADRFFEKIGVL